MNAALFTTLHGSRLYNLHHDNSDYDWYTIYTSGRARQSISGDQDNMKLSLSAFTGMLERGTPQALEACFSRKAEPSLLDEWRFSYRASTAAAANTYRRTMMHFASSTTDPFKRRRHALRLAANLTELMETGQFNPTLSNDQRDQFTMLAALPAAEYMEALTAMSPTTLWDDSTRRQQDLMTMQQFD